MSLTPLSPTVKSFAVSSLPNSPWMYSWRRGPKVPRVLWRSLEIMSITSTRNPSTPRAVQKSTISAISCRTRGFSQFRSAWLTAKEWR